MKNLIITILILLLMMSSAYPGLSRSLSKIIAWVDGQLITLSISSPSGSITSVYSSNKLYMFTGIDGQYPVAEAKPGDINWQDGHFIIYIYRFTDDGLLAHDFNKDGIVDYNMYSIEMADHHINQGHLRLETISIKHRQATK